MTVSPLKNSGGIQTLNRIRDTDGIHTDTQDKRTPVSSYVKPSECDQCIITETTTNQTANIWETELAHQETCPNSPRKDTNIHGK